MAWVWFPAVQDFSLHSIQTGSGAHPASYPMGTGGSSSGGKVARAWSWPLTFIYCWGQEWWSYTSTEYMTSWCGAQLIKHRDNFAFYCNICLELRKTRKNLRIADVLAKMRTEHIRNTNRMLPLDQTRLWWCLVMFRGPLFIVCITSLYLEN
jgi:hypothetical protein